MNINEFLQATDAVARVVGVAVPAVGVFRGLVYEIATLIRHPPQREDGTAWTPDEIETAVRSSFAKLRDEAGAVRNDWEKLL